MTASGTAVVLGAGGGLGQALYQALLDKPDFTTVIGVSRRPAAELGAAEQSWLQADVTSDADLSGVVEHLTSSIGRVDLLINASGMLHRPDERPEKALRELEPDSFSEIMRVNALAPLLALQKFVPLLKRSSDAVSVSLSAMVGSIGDNRLGGWYSYRMSKAALNMGLKTAAIELARYPKAPTVVAIHPGTTSTALSERYLRRRESRSPQCSASHILSVINDLTSQDSGKFFNWDGRELPW